MINPYLLRKWSALLLSALGTTIAFFIGITYYGLMKGLLFMAGGLLVTFILGTLLLKNPFTSMLEGRGVLFFNLDSTGIIQPSILRLKNPYITGKYKGREINDVWDRETVSLLTQPFPLHKKGIWPFRKEVLGKDTMEHLQEGPEQGMLRFTIDQEKFQKSRFQLGHYPVLFWNDQIKSLLTKEWISQQEKETFAEHGILYLNRKVEELSSQMRDFGRYVVESTRPKDKGFFGSTWFWIIIVGVVVVILIMFAPAVIRALQGAAGKATTVTNAMPGASFVAN